MRGDRGWRLEAGAMQRELGELTLFVNRFGAWRVSNAEGQLAGGEAVDMAAGQHMAEQCAAALLATRAQR